MQQFNDETTGTLLAECAGLVLDVGLVVSRFVRAELWRQHPDRMSMEQFRALVFANAFADASPSALAEYLMLTRPAVTRLVDELVARGYVTRHPDAEDRRRHTLALTTDGRRELDAHFAIVRGLVAERIASLTADEQQRVAEAMALVRPRFPARAAAPERAAEAAP